MLTRGTILSLSLLASLGNTVKGEGSFWAVYNTTVAPADASCLVAEGTAVDMACCEDTEDITFHSTLQGEDTCFLLAPGLVPFSGCVGDGVAGYGESCTGEGAPFVAKDAAECGCSFVLEGSGCYKANDLPGQQWFVYLDGDACKDDGPDSSAPLHLYGAYASALLLLSLAALA